MQIALTTFGTRGDVQPFVALAVALQARGHAVTLAVPPNLVEWVARCGVHAERLGSDTRAYMDTDEGRALLAAGNVLAIMKRMGAMMRANRDLMIADHIRVCTGADVIVAGVLTEDHAAAMAEAQGVPLVGLHLTPLRPTGDFAQCAVTTRDMRWRGLHRLSYLAVERMWWASQREGVAALRRRVGLAPAREPTRRRLEAAGLGTLQAFSERIVPRPSDWSPLQRMVGDLRFPEAARRSLGEVDPDPGLSEWFAAGPAPVYVGLGSMPVRDPSGMLDLMAAVARRCGRRMLVGAGWSGMAAVRELPSEIRVVGAVDHDRLLPRCAAAVHHGGAGTTHAVVRAGLPSVVVSVFGDQPFWGARLTRLGIGRHLPFKALTADRLVRALGQITDAATVRRAATVGARMQSDPDGVLTAIPFIEEAGTVGISRLRPVH